MRESMHLGGARTRRWVAVEKNTYVAEPLEEEIIEEEIFNPEAAKTDGNPFPEEPPLEEEVVEETTPLEEEVVEETTPLEEEGPTDYNSLTVEELRALCRARNLAVKGKKAELVTRLLDADAPSKEAVEVTEDTPLKEAVLSDEKNKGSVSNESDETEKTDTVG